MKLSRRPQVLGVTLGVAALLAPPAARADVTDAPAPATARRSPMAASRGLQLGVRAAYAVPAGRVSASGASLSDLETATIPIGIEAGYRISPRLYVGGTAVWGPGTGPAAGPCTVAGVSCFRQDAQARGEARFYFAPEAKVGGWLAVGAGWELATFAQSAGGSAVTATRSGPVLADMQFGVDVRRGPTAVALYAGVSFAMFLTQGLSPSTSPVSPWIEDRSAHAWMTVGLRGSYGPW
ncbi:MAG: hypothetical protein ACRELB_27505 [Polyangiaceae bacterium]